ncbi:phage tail fiber protein [Enterobacter intestinihominis]
MVSKGFKNQGSPVLKMLTDGKYETNHESEGVTDPRLEIGQNLIGGCKGLNSDSARGLSLINIISSPRCQQGV